MSLVVTRRETRQQRKKSKREKEKAARRNSPRYFSDHFHIDKINENEMRNSAAKKYIFQLTLDKRRKVFSFRRDRDEETLWNFSYLFFRSMSKEESDSNTKKSIRGILKSNLSVDDTTSETSKMIRSESKRLKLKFGFLLRTSK